MTRNISISAKHFLDGYTSDATNALPTQLAPPSVNTVIDENGVAACRLGYESLDIDLGTANKPATSYYLKDYDLTFFASGTKLKYYDWTADALVDTGITLTTGTTTRFAEYAGDLYLTNQTDGLRRIVVMRLNGAVLAAASSIIVDTDGAARLSVFSITSGNLLVNGTNEAFNAVTVATGTIGMTVPANTHAYADNTIAVYIHDISSGREKGSKVCFWKERIGIMGSLIAGNTDQPNANVFFGKFATSAALENIIDFTAGGGTDTETVGQGGKITNFLPTEDYLYIFKERESYVIAASDVSITGASIGSSPPNLRSPIHGCVNEDSAADMGNGEVVFLTPNRRVMRIKIATDSGAPVVFPDESFDVPIRELLNTLDADQSGAHMFYHQGAGRLYIEVSIDAARITLVYDNNIKKWLPPQTGKSFKGYFERNGILYATDRTDDTIYQIDSLFTDDGVTEDNGSTIEYYIATGLFDVGNAEMNEMEVKGDITQPTTLYFKVPVNMGTATLKTINGTDYTYGTGQTLGMNLGTTVLAGQRGDEDVAGYHKVFDIYPSDANKVQLISTTTGGWYSLKSYELRGIATESSQPVR